MTQLERVQRLTNRVYLNVMGIEMNIDVQHDKTHNLESHPGWNMRMEPRVYIQLSYKALESKEGLVLQSFKGGKWYLSPHMTDDEIIKKIYLAFRTATEHEVLEGFQIDGIAVFNPHRNFEDLIKLSENPEVIRHEKDRVH